MTRIIASTALVGIAILIIEIRRLGVGKELLISTVRVFVQLMAVGYIIQFVFDLERLQYQILLMLAMVLVASHTARGRVKRVRGTFRIAFVSILSGVSCTVGVMLALGIIDTRPIYLIPLSGMMIGNSMNAVSLGLDRMASEVRDKRGRIEAALSLGATPKKSVERMVIRSVRSSLLPLMNNMKVIGLVHLPGAMTGMLLAGAPPLEAARIQLIVMYMLTASTTISVLVASFFIHRSFFNEAWQLEPGPGADG
jgi:putative ABC transport system permease protein